MANDERIDKWLWATRIFTTRSIATAACKKGRVCVDGVAVKPSRTIKVGDTISVRKPPITYTYSVIGLVQNRVGAKLVPNCLKNSTSPGQYELLEMVKINGFIDRQKGLGRPTKKDGREIQKFTDAAYFGFDDFDDFDDDDFDDEEDED